MLMVLNIISTSFTRILMIITVKIIIVIKVILAKESLKCYWC